MQQSPSDSIFLSLSESQFRLKPGGPPVAVVASVKNLSNVVDRYTVEIEGLDPSWYTISAPVISLFPGDAHNVNITLHPVWQSTLLAGTTRFEVRAYSDNRSLYATTQAAIEIAGETSLQVAMQPQRVKGRRGRFNLTISNTGNESAQVGLSGTDPELALNFNFKNSEPIVEAYQSTSVPVTVTPKTFHLIGQQVFHPFTISATPVEDAPQSNLGALSANNSVQKVQGELVHTAIFKSWIRPALAGLLALALVLLIAFSSAIPGLLSTMQSGLPPSITFFVSSASTVPDGGEVTLRYETKNAVKAMIAEDNREVPVDSTGKGEWHDMPKLARTYTLCVFNKTGNQKCSQPVSISVLPPVTQGTNVLPNATAVAGNNNAGATRTGTSTGGTGAPKPTATRRAAGKTPIVPVIKQGNRAPAATRPPTQLGGGAVQPGATATNTAIAAAASAASTASVAASATASSTVTAARCDTTGNQDGMAVPSSAGLNGSISFQATGFTPNEDILFSLTDPTGTLVGTSGPSSGAVKDDGSLDIEPLTITQDFTQSPGRWSATFLGTGSGHKSRIYFCVAP